MSAPLNAGLDSNACFGCGLGSATGLRIQIFRDPASDSRLVGTFTPRPEHVGFPEIVHGGLQFTALDCMAGWATWVLRAPNGFMPLTAKASMKFMRPATRSQSFALAAEVAREAATPRDPVLWRTTLSDESGQVLSEAEFEYVVVPAERFVKLVGLNAMPAHYQRWFDGHRP